MSESLTLQPTFSHSCACSLQLQDARHAAVAAEESHAWRMGELQERLDALMEQMREAAEASSAQASTFAEERAALQRQKNALHDECRT